MPVFLASRVAAGDRRRIGVPVPGSSHLYLKTAPSRTRVTITRTLTKGSRRALSLMLPSVYYAMKNLHKTVSLDYFERVTDPPIPIQLPFLVVEPKTTSSKREVRDFIETHQGILENIGRRAVYIFRNSSFEVGNAIIESGLFRHDSDSIANAINVDEMRVLSNVLRQLNALLHTLHTLPSALAKGDKGVRLVSFPSTDILTSDTAGSSQSASAMDTDTFLKTDNEQSMGLVSYVEVGRLDYDPKAFPTSGFVLPFDQSSECADLLCVPSFLTTFCSGFFGPANDTRTRELNRMRGAWTAISRTMCGYQVSHLVKSLELAILGDAVLVPIIRDRSYKGSVLLSPHVIINDSYEQHFASPAEDLLQQVASLDAYSRAHLAINNIIREACNRTELSEEEVTNVLLWKTTRQLSNACITLPFTTEEKDQLVALAADTQRSGEYFQNSPDYLIKAIAMLADETIHVPDDSPMFPGALFFRSRTEEILSLFGPMVPCVDIPGAPTMTLRSVSKPPSQNFVARPFRFQEAISNWDNWRRAGQLRNGPPVRSAALHDRAFEGRDRTRVWEAVMKLFEEPESDGDEVEFAPPAKRANVGTSAFDMF